MVRVWKTKSLLFWYDPLVVDDVTWPLTANGLLFIWSFFEESVAKVCSLLQRTTEKIFSLFKFLVFVFFQNATADFITKCDGLLLKSATSVITKCDRTTFQSRRVTQIWLHACGYGKDVHGAVEFSCTLITKGTERSNTLRLSYCSFTAE